MSSNNLTDAKKIFATYGKALKKARIKKDYKKQYKFADAIKVKQSEVSRWENTDAEPLDHNKRKIEQVLNLFITPVKGGWAISDSQDPEFESQFRKEVSHINEKLTLDDLPRLIRERDELQRKIDKLVRNGG